MRSREEITREVESWNEFRAEVGLPLVSVPDEVEKIYKAELWQDFRDLVLIGIPTFRHRIEAEELERERRERYDPTWVPRGLLNGAGAYGVVKVQDRMLSLWKQQRKADGSARQQG